MKSDSNRIVRLLPIWVGGLGGSLLMINRLLTPELSSFQARSDALGVILSAVLILVGLLWQRIQAKPPDTVTLIGSVGFELAADLPDEVKNELAWASHLILTNTVTRSVVIWSRDRVLLRRGVLGNNQKVNLGLIVNRVLEKQQAVYLVDLKAYPGKIEFDYLPENTQGIICQPMGDRSVMILGANAPRSYTKQDEIWIEGIADKISVTLKNYEL